MSLHWFVSLSFSGLPAVGYATAVASHSQTFLEVRGKAWSGDASAAVRANTLLVFPLVVYLAKNIQPWLVHNFWKCKAGAGLFCVESFSCKHKSSINTFGIVADEWVQATCGLFDKTIQTCLVLKVYFCTAWWLKKKERKRKEKQVLPSFPMERDNEIEFTKIPHAFLVRVIQEKIALLDSPVDLKAKPQACILHQVRQDVLS